MKKFVVIVLLVVLSLVIGLMIAFNNMFDKVNEPFHLRKESIIQLKSLDNKTERIFLRDNKKLLFFFKTDCQMCIEQFDSIEKYRNNFNAEIYLISFESHDSVKSFINNKYRGLRIYTAKEDELMFGKKINIYPTALVIDNDSIVDFGIGDLIWKDIVIQ